MFTIKVNINLTQIFYIFCRILGHHLKGKLIDQKQRDVKSLRHLQKSWKETEAKTLCKMNCFLNFVNKKIQAKKFYLRKRDLLLFLFKIFLNFFFLVLLLASKDSILLDIGRDMEAVTGREKQFCTGQMSICQCCISEKIDEDYTKEKEVECQERFQLEERDKLEEAFINEEEENISILSSTFDENILNTSLNRSGRVCSTKKSSDATTQTDHKFNAPKIQINSKVCTDQVKSTCASASTKCEVSVEVARLAVKTVMKGMYDHDVCLNTEDHSAAEQLTPPENDRNEPPSKKKRTVPSSKADYDKYQYVLPSAQTITDYKHMQASKAERNAAIAFYREPDAVKRIMHYDTTTRGSIDREWPSIILKLSSGQEYRLHPLFFAYEYREQITILFIETYK